MRVPRAPLERQRAVESRPSVSGVSHRTGRRRAPRHDQGSDMGMGNVERLRHQGDSGTVGSIEPTVVTRRATIPGSRMRGWFGIGIESPKREFNTGTLYRSAYCLGAHYIFTIGRRYHHTLGDTTKSWRNIPAFS